MIERRHDFDGTLLVLVLCGDQRGGTPSQTVTKGTKLLIVGELGWPLLDDGRPSNKLSRASAFWYSGGK